MISELWLAAPMTSRVVTPVRCGTIHLLAYPSFFFYLAIESNIYMFFSKRRKLSWSGQQDKKKMYLGERPEIDLLLPGRDRIIILKKKAREREKQNRRTTRAGEKGTSPREYAKKLHGSITKMEWGRSEEKGRKIRVWQERPKGISHDCNRWLSSQATWLPDGVFIFYFYFFYPSVLSLSLLHIQKEPLTLFSTWTQPPTPQHLNSPRSDEARKMGQADKWLTTFPSFFLLLLLERSAGE